VTGLEPLIIAACVAAVVGSTEPGQKWTGKAWKAGGGPDATKRLQEKSAEAAGKTVASAVRTATRPVTATGRGAAKAGVSLGSRLESRWDRRDPETTPVLWRRRRTEEPGAASDGVGTTTALVDPPGCSSTVIHDPTAGDLERADLEERFRSATGGLPFPVWAHAYSTDRVFLRRHARDYEQRVRDLRRSADASGDQAEREELLRHAQDFADAAGYARRVADNMFVSMPPVTLEDFARRVRFLEQQHGPAPGADPDGDPPSTAPIPEPDATTSTQEDTTMSTTTHIATSGLDLERPNSDAEFLDSCNTLAARLAADANVIEEWATGVKDLGLASSVTGWLDGIAEGLTEAASSVVRAAQAFEDTYEDARGIASRGMTITGQDAA
jgi:hypothetical protein